MMKKKVMVLMCAAMVALGSMACGSNDTAASAGSSASLEETTKEADTEENATEEEGYSFSTDLLYNDADELIVYVPYAPTDNSYAEAMTQVTGYTYAFLPEGTDYTLIVTYECGEPGADTTMYMKRTLEFTGTCTADGDNYSLNAPEHLKMTQETGGQFAATSGEGGADYWGPNGFTMDETFTNSEGYGGVYTGAEYLAAFSACTATVDGDSVSFEAAAAQ